MNIDQWFQNYLSNRKQAVSINGDMSSSLACNIGVPQGSVVGPVLFLLFINDLPTAVQRRFINLFADGTSMYGGEQDLDNLEVLL